MLSNVKHDKLGRVALYGSFSIYFLPFYCILLLLLLMSLIYFTYHLPWSFRILPSTINLFSGFNLNMGGEVLFLPWFHKFREGVWGPFPGLSDQSRGWGPFGAYPGRSKAHLGLIQGSMGPGACLGCIQGGSEVHLGPIQECWRPIWSLSRVVGGPSQQTFIVLWEAFGRPFGTRWNRTFGTTTGWFQYDSGEVCKQINNNDNSMWGRSLYRIIKELD